jgi:hypothetical protein
LDANKGCVTQIPPFSTRYLGSPRVARRIRNHCCGTTCSNPANGRPRCPCWCRTYMASICPVTMRGMRPSSLLHHTPTDELKAGQANGFNPQHPSIGSGCESADPSMGRGGMLLGWLPHGNSNRHLGKAHTPFTCFVHGLDRIVLSIADQRVGEPLVGCTLGQSKGHNRIPRCTSLQHSWFIRFLACVFRRRCSIV